METKKHNRYIVLISGMLIQLCAGIIYMWSVFKQPVATHLSWDPSKAALTSSIMLAAFVIGIVIGGRLQDKIGPRLACIIGSLLVGIGMAATGFVSSQNPGLVYLTYGIIGGLGVGFVYTTTVSVIQKWFPDKRGLATGLMVGAFGFSLVIFAPLVTLMLSSIGVANTFFVLGASFLLICVGFSLFIKNPREGYTPKNFVATPKNTAAKQYSTLEMLKTGQFYLILASMAFILPSYFILNPLLMSLGVERGLSADSALLGVMITGIASASGRIIASWVSDIIGRKAAIVSIIIITLAATLTMIFANNILFLICIATIAFAFGGTAGVFPAITADSFGTKNMGLNYGCVMVGFGLSALFSPMISNMLVKSGEYKYSFILASATCLVSLVFILLLKSPQNMNKQVKK